MQPVSLISSSNLTAALRHSINNCSSSHDPLENVRKLGFTESAWNTGIANRILDDLFVEYESSFASQEEKQKWARLSSFRKRRHAKALLRDLMGCRRQHFRSFVVLGLANCFLSPTSPDITLSSFRSLALPLLIDDTALPHSGCSNKKETICPVQLNSPDKNNVELLRHHLLTIALAVIGQFSSHRAFTACPSSVVNKIPQPSSLLSDFVLECHRSSSTSLRKIVFESLSALLLQTNDSESRQQLHRVIFSVMLLLLPPTIECSPASYSQLVLYDSDLMWSCRSPVRSSAYILLNLDPFALSPPCFVWACQMVLQYWTKISVDHPLDALTEILLLRSLKWLHASLVFLLTIQTNSPSADSSTKVIVTFLSAVFVFPSLPSSVAANKMLPSQERTNRMQAFELAVVQLVSQLRHLTSLSTPAPPLTANRLLAPFRQFASRCNLVAKIASVARFSSSAIAPQLHPIGQCLLCIFIVLNTPTHSLCPPILDSLLGTEMPHPPDRFLAMFEAAEIVMKMASINVNNKTGEMSSLISIKDRRYELRMLLRTLAGHYLNGDAALRTTPPSYDKLYYEQIDSILSIDE